MFEFHKDRKQYFDIQVANARDYVLPFIEQVFPIQTGMRVLEIGCGEGGVLKAFLDRGCTGIGVEFDAIRVEWAHDFMPEDIAAGRVRFLAKDIYDADKEKDFGGGFDVIVLKDVIEHIHDQPKLIARMREFLNPQGVIFFGFPPWMMPFGGHQQICQSKFLSKTPWIHLLPRPMYGWLLKVFKEQVEGLLEIYDTRITIEGFEKMAAQAGYQQINRLFYLINPIYQWKFGWKPKHQYRWLSKLPWIRNFFTTCVYYLIQLPKAKGEN